MAETRFVEKMTGEAASRSGSRSWRRVAVGLSAVVLALAAGVGDGRGASGHADGGSCQIEGSGGTPGSFPSLQAAVDSVSVDGRFEVSGTCVGTTTIDGKFIALFNRKVDRPAVLDGNGEGSVLTIIGGGTISAQRVSVTGGAAADGGGIDLVSGVAYLKDSTVGANAASAYGGGVYVSPGSRLSCPIRCDVQGNSAVSGGGGVYVEDAGSAVFFPSSAIDGNTVSAGNGGGVAVGAGGFVSVLGGNGYGVTDVDGNSASGSGGGIWSAGTLTISGEVCDNTAGAGGGGVANVGGAVTIFGNGHRICGNSAAFGGGLLNRSGTVNFEVRAALDANHAAGNGGGIDNEGGTVALTGNYTSVAQNVAGGLGGGVYNGAQGTLTLSGDPSSIRDNTASRGGGVYNLGTLSLSGRHRINNNHPDNIYP